MNVKSAAVQKHFWLWSEKCIDNHVTQDAVLIPYLHWYDGGHSWQWHFIDGHQSVWLSASYPQRLATCCFVTVYSHK